MTHWRSDPKPSSSTGVPSGFVAAHSELIQARWPCDILVPERPAEAENEFDESAARDGARRGAENETNA